MFEIVIPTLGRDMLVTPKHIPKTMYGCTWLATPVSEVNRPVIRKWEEEGIGVVEVPNRIKGISKTRKWILENFEGHVLMLDDDMDFCYRPVVDEPKLITLTPENKEHQKLMMKMFRTLYQWLEDGFVHVGISARQGNNRVLTEYRDAGRMMNAYAYNAKALQNLPVKLGRMDVMEDFDLTLQLLEQGYPNRVMYRWCWNQRRSGAKGGCSLYRTGKMQADSARKLAKFHPDFVKLVEKKSKSAWEGMETRLDVNIQWRKAYEYGKRKARGM